MLLLLLLLHMITAVVTNEHTMCTQNNECIYSLYVKYTYNYKYVHVHNIKLCM